MSTRKKLISLSCILVIVALVSAIALTVSVSSSTGAFADEIIVSNFSSVDGILYDSNNKPINSETAGADYVFSDGKYHMTQSKAQNVYSGKTVTFISDRTGFKNFIDSCSNSSTSNKVGVLTADIDYNLKAMGITGSTAAFFGTLDGNGYNVNITSADGGSTLAYNTDYPTAAGNGTQDWTFSVFYTRKYLGYYYSGIICAVNEGDIKNCNFIWKSELQNSSTNTDSTNLHMDGYVQGGNSGRYYTGVAGLVCGLLYNGTINNCYIDIQKSGSKGAFAVAKGSGDCNSYAANALIVGGVAGVISSNAILERTTVNNEGGIAAIEDGYTKGKASSICGGLAGVLRGNDSTAKVLNCSISGTGSVGGIIGWQEGGMRPDAGYGMAGGAIGSTSRFVNVDTMTGDNEDNPEELAAEGSIVGIVSSWTGLRESFWDDGTNKTDITKVRKTIAGCLFDFVGTEVKNVVLLFDYLSLVKSASNELGSVYTWIDSAMKMGYGSWTEIYATNNTGTVNVRYDYSRATDPIRVEACANGFFEKYNGEGALNDELPSSRSNEQFLLKETTDNLGFFIWSSNYCSDEKDVVTGAHIDASGDLVGAEIYYISENLLGSVNYTFGEKTTMTFDNNNTSSVTNNFISEHSKYYNGEVILDPSLNIKRGNGESVIINDNAFEKKEVFTILDGENPTDYSYVITDSAYNYLPGLYTYTVSKDITFFDGTKKSYAYYDENSLVLVANNDENVYEYAIYTSKSGMFTAEATTSASSWGLKDDITISYNNKANAIDYYTYSIGTGAQTDVIEMPENQARTTVEATESGKNKYNFRAYVINPFAVTTNKAEKYLLVGTASVNTYIDNAAPEYKNIKYYEYDETADDKIGFELLEEELNDWVSGSIWVVYTVTDNFLSGIATGVGDDEEYREESNGKYNCKVLLTGENPTVETVYTDTVGNTARRTFSANIDSTPVSIEDVIALNSQEYLVYYAIYGYCPIEVVLSFTPVFGKGGAYMQYSYEQDAEGNDIWVTYDKELNANTPNTFVVNFELIEKNFKMRLRSNTGLYADAYANGDGCVTNGASIEEESKVWTIKITIAYIGITLNNIIYNDQALSSYADLASIFNKDYDGTDSSNLDLSVKVYQFGTRELAGTSIVYTDKYNYQRPQIDVNCLKVNVKYSSKDAGQRVVSLSVDSIGEYAGKYEVYFSNVILENVVDFADKNKSQEICNANIYKKKLNISVADYTDQIKPEYEYGTEIPSQIIIDGEDEEKLVLDLVTNAKITYDEDGNIVYPNAAKYTTSVKFAEENNNYELVVTTMDVQITKKAVAVSTQLDGKSSYSTNVTFDGNVHAITGTYTDVNGNDAKIEVAYYSTADCQESSLIAADQVKSLGTYYVKISIPDNNYELLNSSKIVQFSIIKGYLNIDLTKQTYEFSNDKVKFAINTLGNISKDYYKDTDFAITYYTYVDGYANYSNPMQEITKVGNYLVHITLNENSYFFTKNYDDTYIEITKAATTLTASDIHVTYDGNAHAYTLSKDSKISVISVESKTTVIGEPKDLKNYDGLVYFDLTGDVNVEKKLSESNVVDLQYWDAITRKYVLITDEDKGEFLKTGVYSYKIIFKGDANYNENSLIVKLYINTAEFKDVAFENTTVNFTGEEFVYKIDDSEGSALKTYLDMGASLVYTCNGENREYGTEGFEYFKFKDVGTYNITAILTMENYRTSSLSGIFTIDKTAFTGIQPVMQSTTIYYDGYAHPADFTIPGEKARHYLKGFEDEKVVDTVDVEVNGEIIVFSVYYDDEALPYDAGSHYGKMQFVSEEFATVEINTAVTIDPLVVTVSFKTLQTYFDKITAKTNIKNLNATFLNEDGQEDVCYFEYYKTGTNQKVNLDANGCLPAGSYDVKLVFGSSNYTTTQTIQSALVVKESSSGNNNPGQSGGEGQTDSGSSFLTKIIDNILYVAIGVGAVVVVAIVAIVVSASKKKKKGKKGKGKPKKPTPKQKNNAAGDKATF